MFPIYQNEDVFTFDRDKSLSRAALKREAFKQARMLSLSPNFERQGNIQNILSHSRRKKMIHCCRVQPKKEKHMQKKSTSSLVKNVFRGDRLREKQDCGHS